MTLGKCLRQVAGGWTQLLHAFSTGIRKAAAPPVASAECGHEAATLQQGPPKPSSRAAQEQGSPPLPSRGSPTSAARCVGPGRAAWQAARRAAGWPPHPHRCGRRLRGAGGVREGYAGGGTREGVGGAWRAAPAVRSGWVGCMGARAHRMGRVSLRRAEKAACPPMEPLDGACAVH